MKTQIKQKTETSAFGTARREERGTELLEFALVVVVLFVFIFGIIDFGRALYAYHFVANAARQATRFAIVRGANCQGLVPAGSCPILDSVTVQNWVRTNLATGIGIDPNMVLVTASWTAPAVSAVSCTTNAVTGLMDNPGCEIQVQVQYPFKFIFPLMPTRTCQVGTPPQTGSICMSSTSEMIISN